MISDLSAAPWLLALAFFAAEAHANDNPFSQCVSRHLNFFLTPDELDYTPIERDAGISPERHLERIIAKQRQDKRYPSFLSPEHEKRVIQGEKYWLIQAIPPSFRSGGSPWQKALSRLPQMKATPGPGGIFTDSQGRPLRGVFSFVMTAQGEFLVSHPLTWNLRRFHVGLDQGRPVASAGTMIFKDGRLEFINDASGGYRPHWEHLIQALRRLAETGVDLRTVRIGFYR